MWLWLRKTHPLLSWTGSCYQCKIEAVFIFYSFILWSRGPQYADGNRLHRQRGCRMSVPTSRSFWFGHLKICLLAYHPTTLLPFALKWHIVQPVWDLVFLNARVTVNRIHISECRRGLGPISDDIIWFIIIIINWDWWRKLEYLEGTHKDAGRRCKLFTERPWPGIKART